MFLQPAGLLLYLTSKETVPDGEAEDVLQLRDNLKLALDHAAKTQRSQLTISFEKNRRIMEKHIEVRQQNCKQSLGVVSRKRMGNQSSVAIPAYTAYISLDNLITCFHLKICFVDTRHATK